MDQFEFRIQTIGQKIVRFYFRGVAIFVDEIWKEKKKKNAAVSIQRRRRYGV